MMNMQQPPSSPASTLPPPPPPSSQPPSNAPAQTAPAQTAPTQPHPTAGRGVPGRRTNILKQVFIIFLVVVIVFCLVFLYYWVFVLPDNSGLPDWLNPSTDITCSEWACDVTQVDEMNALGYHGNGIVIGIVDSGIDTTHPDIDPNCIMEWKDYVNGEADPYDDDGHGTAMAGIIIADGDLQGIANEAKLIVVKAIDSDGLGDPADVVSGIEFCMDPNGDGDLSDGADIISLSLGGPESKRFWDSDEVKLAARKAANSGIFVVASAGNDGLDDDGDVGSPATEELVIAVGAIDSSLTIADFSSIGDNDGRPRMSSDDREDPNMKPEIVAPGVRIATTYLDESYVDIDGTSPAAAFVSGSLALLLEAHPSYMIKTGPEKVVELKTILMETSEKLDDQDTPHDDYYGYGLIKVRYASEAM